MNCFVIMPFSPEFDDVYAAIKIAVESTTSAFAGRCFRLDESRPAGRITDRLITELHSATICIADLTEERPNVMWELGFAMALGKPTVILTQNESLPFDVHDMQKIVYRRLQLDATLVAPLKRTVFDTCGSLLQQEVTSMDATASTLGTMLAEISQLKTIIAEFVAWKNVDGEPNGVPQAENSALVGHWYNSESSSNVYARNIRGELVAPYCFGGNRKLVGVYFGWRRIGEYWYARYQWIHQDICGFSFLRMDSMEKMTGAWWPSENNRQDETSPPRDGGIPASWIKQSSPAPSWAEDFFREVEQEGLASWLARYR